jgi:hypothetical protein
VTPANYNNFCGKSVVRIFWSPLNFSNLSIAIKEIFGMSPGLASSQVLGISGSSQFPFFNIHRR